MAVASNSKPNSFYGSLMSFKRKLFLAGTP
jgi:hypothetical protein